MSGTPPIFHVNYGVRLSARLSASYELSAVGQDCHACSIVPGGDEGRSRREVAESHAWVSGSHRIHVLCLLRINIRPRGVRPGECD